MPTQDKRDRDLRFLRQAEGWLELGGAVEALQELEQISGVGSSNIDVLRARYSAWAATAQWDYALMVSEVTVDIFPGIPEGWLWRAHAIRVLSQSAAKARDSLKPASDRFPNDPIILLNLALYESELGDSSEATGWLSKTRRAVQNTENMEMVLRLLDQNAGLRALWDSVAQSTMA